MQDLIYRLEVLAARGQEVDVLEARSLIRNMTQLFTALMTEAGHNQRQIVRSTTKFRGCRLKITLLGVRTSSRVPGRPQDGSDGNRISRWLLPEDHKFHAPEIIATLVEVKYYPQALAMSGAPVLPKHLSEAFQWLVEHPVEAGYYLDPIQLIEINLHEIVNDARSIQSGHLVPLDRGGRHEPRNAFLMLARSNQLQGQSYN